MGAIKTDIQELAVHLQCQVAHKRLLIGIAGPPGSGKSTFCEKLNDQLNRAQPGLSAIFPMDGFHFDDVYLNEMGWRARKGAPHTFDVTGFMHTLKRLKANTEKIVMVPVFDRDIEISRAGARGIVQETNIILVEGNYLLLDRDGWQEVAGLFDLTVMLTTPIEILEQRLSKRWIDQGMETAEISRKLESNDLPNVRLVLANSVAADYEVRTHA